MSLPVSPLAPERFPAIAPIAGVEIATCNCGIRYKNRHDLLLMRFAPGTNAAGIFTRSLMTGAPVEWCRQALASSGGKARGLLVNAGNANAFTGRAGNDAVRITTSAAADLLGCPAEEVYAASTGTIGVPLPHGKITGALPDLAQALSADAWEAAARAIMTTDTFPKAATRNASIAGRPVRIAGIAKGSGMIAPDMATMLAYVATDAAIAAPVLDRLLRDGADRSFHCITVDSDTSTSDTLMLFATGAAGNPMIDRVEDPDLEEFQSALDDLLLDLALQVVRDGEGAQKLVEVRVTGAESDAAARRIAFAIANSPLVKTAIAGEDANWGRIVMAVGKAGERADRDALRIAIGGTVVTENGAAVEGYDETPVVAHMRTRSILIEVHVGVGGGRGRVWTCDLTHGYIDINGSYRT